MMKPLLMLQCSHNATNEMDRVKSHGAEVEACENMTCFPGELSSKLPSLKVATDINT